VRSRLAAMIAHAGISVCRQSLKRLANWRRRPTPAYANLYAALISNARDSSRFPMPEWTCCGREPLGLVPPW
jgi:hypothetical protein